MEPGSGPTTRQPRERAAARLPGLEIVVDAAAGGGRGRCGRDRHGMAGVPRSAVGGVGRPPSRPPGHRRPPPARRTDASGRRLCGHTARGRPRSARTGSRDPVPGLVEERVVGGQQPFGRPFPAKVERIDPSPPRRRTARPVAAGRGQAGEGIGQTTAVASATMTPASPTIVRVSARSNDTTGRPMARYSTTLVIVDTSLNGVGGSGRDADMGRRQHRDEDRRASR